MTNSKSEKSRIEKRTNERVDALLEQLERMSSDAATDQVSTLLVMDHRMRTLFSKCVQKLQAAQVEIEQAATDSRIMNERAEALLGQADSLTFDAKTRLKTAQAKMRASVNGAKEITDKSESSALDVLESAIELADSYVGHHEINAEAVEDWVANKAGRVASEMIGDLESRIVEIGSVGDDESPHPGITTLNAA